MNTVRVLQLAFNCQYMRMRDIPDVLLLLLLLV